MDFYKTHKIEIRFVIGLENMLFADVCVCVCAIFSPKCLQARAVKGLIVVLLPVLRRIPQITKIVGQWQLQVQLHVTAWMNVASTFSMAESVQCSFLFVRGVHYSH